MAKKELARFLAEHVGQRPDVHAQLAAITDDAGLVRALVAEGKRAGYEFSEVDVLATLRGPQGSTSGELADTQLDDVAGGRVGTSSDKMKYMEMTLKEILISPVSP
jgi:hypothetical protein